MIERAIAGGRVVERPWRGFLRVRNQLGYVVRGERWVGDQHVSGDGGRRDRNEVLDRVEADARIQRRVDYLRAVGRKQQRVAVGLRLRRERGADVASGAGAVIDDHRLLEDRAELLRDDPRDRIVRAARGLRDDDDDRFFGIDALRKGRRRNGSETSESK